MPLDTVTEPPSTAQGWLSVRPTGGQFGYSARLIIKILTQACLSRFYAKRLSGYKTMSKPDLPQSLWITLWMNIPDIR